MKGGQHFIFLLCIAPVFSLTCYQTNSTNGRLPENAETSDDCFLCEVFSPFLPGPLFYEMCFISKLGLKLRMEFKLNGVV